MLEELDNRKCVDVCDREWKGLRIKLAEHTYTHCIILAGTNDVAEESPEDIVDNIKFRESLYLYISIFISVYCERLVQWQRTQLL